MIAIVGTVRLAERIIYGTHVLSLFTPIIKQCIYPFNNTHLFVIFVTLYLIYPYMERQIELQGQKLFPTNNKYKDV